MSLKKSVSSLQNGYKIKKRKTGERNPTEKVKGAKKGNGREKLGARVKGNERERGRKRRI